MSMGLTSGSITEERWLLPSSDWQELLREECCLTSPLSLFELECCLVPCVQVIIPVVHSGSSCVSQHAFWSIVLQLTGRSDSPGTPYAEQARLEPKHLPLPPAEQELKVCHHSWVKLII